MKRFLVTLITIVTLAGTFRVYSAVILPLTEVKQGDRPLVDPLETDIRAPAIFEQQAVTVFPESPWTHQAEQSWQLAESAYLYFNSFVRVPGSGNAIQISPVAIFWQDPKRPDAKPFRVVAERAQIKFQNSFFDSAISMSNTNPGRIVWASLEGTVKIDGPDGLKIDGQNFKFEEESLLLYSDHAVAFAYGPTPADQRKISGTAEQLQLTFEPSHESILGKDMPRIGGLAQILLRRNVALDMAFEQKGEPRIAQIRSAGSFLYDLQKREANLDDHVRVVHIADPATGKRKDTIDCHSLQLQFDSAATPQSHSKPSPTAAFDGLVFRRLKAQGSESGRGSRMTITSDDQQLNAEMQDLTYDAKERIAILIDQKQVVVHRANTSFACPQIALQHSQENQLEDLECRGPGQMEVHPENPSDPGAFASWQAGVRVTPDPKLGVHYVRINEKALLGVPGQFGIGADVMHLWIDLERVPKQSSPSIKNAPPQGTPSLLAGALPLKQARAEGNVRLESPLLRVKRARLIDLTIRPGLIENSMQAMTSPGSGGDQSSERDEPWSVEAETLNVHLIHDSGKSLIDFQRITGEGNIQIQHDPGKATVVGNQTIEGPLTIKGQSMIVQNEGGVRQVATLSGQVGEQGEIQQNASVELGQAALRGSHIKLARFENRIDVPGPGGLTVPLPQSPTGKSSTGPTKLDIVWSEGMAFDGQAARFWGKVTAVVPDDQQNISRLRCEDLTATLNRKISFTEPVPKESDYTIHEVSARHNVIVEAFEYALNKLAAVRRSEMASFEVDFTTGDFEGFGPANIHSWSLGDSVKLAPGESPRANQPAKPNSKDQWRYAYIGFVGSLKGNINRNDATLHERVEVLTAPVEKALTKFRRDQLSDSTPEAENAVWMKCREMRILQKPGATSAEKHYEVFASGDTELEGHVFRAVADVLTFDDLRGEFTLRGLGREAELYHQPNPGKAVSPSSARMIRFIPAKQYISVDGSSGISGSY